jgi:hypothetical protein
MARSNQVKLFLASEDGLWLKKELESMVSDPGYNTRSTYTTAAVGEQTFVDKHMEYMCRFPYINHRQYVSNLKLKTKRALIA